MAVLRHLFHERWQVCRWAGVRVCRYAVGQVCGCAGMQVVRFAGVQVCRWAGVRVCRYAGGQVCVCVQRCQRCVGSNGPISTIMRCCQDHGASNAASRSFPAPGSDVFLPRCWMLERLCALLCGFDCTARCSSGKFLNCRLVQNC